MGKPVRKPRPSIPNCAWLDRDGCWFCKKIEITAISVK